MESSMNSDTKRYIKIGDMNIEILAKSESVKYLGQRISFYQQETLEIKSRIRAAWTCSNSAFDSSTPRSLRLLAALLEHGHRAENTKE